MNIQLVNIGTANKGNGDPIRTAFNKINNNFTNIDNTVTILSSIVTSISTESSLSFDFGSINPRAIVNPLELLFYASQIDMGTILSPTPVLYDAGTFE